MRFPLRWGPLLGVVVAVASLGMAAACGSRTGLALGDVVDDDDAGDAFVRKDVVPDRRPDVVLPPIDASPLPDVYRNDCPDAAITLIYVITDSYDLYSFNPSTGAFSRIGAISCPAAAGATPFSMAVDRKGTAFVVFRNVDPNSGNSLPGDGTLFRVSTATAACIATSFKPYRPTPTRAVTFGMGFSSNVIGGAETLYIATDDTASMLGTIDVSTFNLGFVGPFNPEIAQAELTGTGDGRLFAFYQRTQGSAIAQIDKTSGFVVAESPLPTVDQGNHWAFGFWGGDFYTFTGPPGTTDVTRFRPSDGSVVVVGTLADSIVGAGVSTCAPEK